MLTDSELERALRQTIRSIEHDIQQIDTQLDQYPEGEKPDALLWTKAALVSERIMYEARLKVLSV